MEERRRDQDHMQLLGRPVAHGAVPAVTGPGERSVAAVRSDSNPNETLQHALLSVRAHSGQCRLWRR